MLTSHVIEAGLVGCGDIAIKHLEATLAVPSPPASASASAGLRFTALTDLDSARAEALGAKLGIPSCADLEALLALPISLVSVCTPNQTHASLARRCLEAGKHVLLEHPMALSSVEAQSLVEACRTTGRQLFVVRQRRYTRTIQALRRAVAEGLLGSIGAVELSLAWNRGPDYFTARPWRKLRDGGGVLVNQASHFLDILLYVFGDVTAVTGTTGTLRHAIDCEDTALGSLSFASGTNARFDLTVAAPKGCNTTSLKVETELGPVQIGGRQLDAFVGRAPDCLHRLAADAAAPAEGDHAGYLHRVARRIAGDAGAEVVTVDDGARTVRLLEAMHASFTRDDAQLRDWYASQFGGAA